MFSDYALDICFGIGFAYALVDLLHVASGIMYGF